MLKITLPVYELLDISSQNISNRIDVQQGLFITIYLAVFGGIR